MQIERNLASSWQNNTYNFVATRDADLFDNETVSLCTRRSVEFYSILWVISEGRKSWGAYRLHASLISSRSSHDFFLEAILKTEAKRTPQQKTCIAVYLGKRCPRAIRRSRKGLMKKGERSTLQRYVEYEWRGLIITWSASVSVIHWSNDTVTSHWS